MNKKKLKGEVLHIALPIAIKVDKSTLDKCVETGMQVAELVQEQLIEKFADWLEKNIPSSDLERKLYNCFSAEQKSKLIERCKIEFKKL